ncbi:MAG TPA: hypothetical protein VEF92_06770 [Burkholderiales bacterium]|nr:hypothetical protein [Burkholderiales bacterium]HYA47239.1 hypothetical protein [Burkholderiales bacterium]
MLVYPGRFEGLVQAVTQRIRMRFPPVVANDPERSVSQERIAEILRETLAAALQSGREDRMGFFGKLRLRNAFKRELREIGYDEKFVAFASDQFMEQLGRRAA